MGRKQKKYHYIYKTTNILSGKYYIGMHSTDNLDDGYLGSGTRLRRSINKYGKDNFKREILEFVDTRGELKAREEEIVNLDEIAKVDCINLKVGGYGGIVDEEHHQKMREGASKSLLERWNDPVIRERFINHIRKANKIRHKNGDIKSGKDVFDWSGKKHSEETIEKMKESRKGIGKGSSNSQFGKCWITNGEENKKMMKGDEIPIGWRLGRIIKL